MADRRKTAALLQQTRHRPYPVPPGEWTYYQEWKDVLFLHWRADIKTLSTLVPSPLEIDTLDGDGWVTIVLFAGEQFHPRFAFPIPVISNFLQGNLRTYVKYQNRQGIYFLSLATNKALTSFLSRIMTGLPYLTSKIDHARQGFKMGSGKHGFSLEVSYKERWRIASKSVNDRWLTDRYCVYDVTKGNVFRHEVHHPDWPLHTVSIQKMDVVTAKKTLDIQNSPALAHFSYGVPVLAWKRVIT
jgi:uncharacterized protein